MIQFYCVVYTHAACGTHSCCMQRVLSSLLFVYLFYFHIFFMAFCRASGHVLVITICHWFPVNSDGRPSTDSLPPWQSLCVHVIFFLSFPLHIFIASSSLRRFVLVLFLSLALSLSLSSSAFGPWYIMACRLSCLFALFNKTWQQQQLPLAVVVVVIVVFVVLGLGEFLLLWRIFCYDGNWDICCCCCIFIFCDLLYWPQSHAFQIDWIFSKMSFGIAF